MSYADKLFVENCRDIINNGFSDEGFHVRPKWADGSPAHTKKQLYVTDRYTLAKDSIPVMTLRRQGIRNCIDEILWIYQKMSNRLEDLHSHIWDSWNIGDGTIGKAYGYQISIMSKHHQQTYVDDRLTAGFYGPYRIEHDNITGKDWVYLTQMGAVLHDLEHKPGDRAIMTNTYNHQDLLDMGLRPCAYSMQFNVTMNSDGQKVLNGNLFQRSQDMLTANGWNVIQYAVLLQMVAQVTDMVPGTFVHTIADCHIYDRHIPIVQEMIDTYDKAMKDANVPTCYSLPYSNPTFWINPEVKNFFEFTLDDFKLENYQACEFNHKIGNGPGCDVEVAV